MHKRLIKGEQKIFGVCSGIGNYLDIDPTIIRVLLPLPLYVSEPVFSYI